MNPGVPFGHDDRRDLLAEPSARRSPVTAVTVTNRVIGGARVGDELLRAVDDPLAAVEHARSCAWRRRPTPPRARSARSPRAPCRRAGRAATRCFCASVPKRKTGMAPRLDAGLEGDRDATGRRGRAPRSRGTARSSRRPGRRTPRGTAGRTGPARPSARRCRSGSVVRAVGLVRPRARRPVGELAHHVGELAARRRSGRSVHRGSFAVVLWGCCGRVVGVRRDDVATHLVAAHLVADRRRRA